jgi:predicted Zn-dependent peptidase
MIKTHRLSNGLTVVVEELEHVESAAYDLLIPGGLIVDDKETKGATVVLADLLGRGAGPYASRELSDAFDSLGVRHGEGAGLDKFALSGVLVADALEGALQLVSHMVQEPRLPEGEIDPIRSLMLQDIAALKDNPGRRAGVELNARYYPDPYNRSTLGDAEGLGRVNRETVERLCRSYFRPDRAILSVAGKVQSEAVFALVNRLFGGWEGTARVTPAFSQINPHDYFHIESDSAQVQILMASPSVPFGADGYYAGKLAVSLLGASMFGRLFVEVREKRGLCYSVYARHASNNSYGTVTAYVGTTAERAQESLDVLMQEMHGLKGTVRDDELERAKVNLKASLVLGEESPGSRASSNATDWWLLGRIRSLTEISSEIDKVSKDSIDAFLSQYPFSPCSLLTLGNRKLDLPASTGLGR